MSQPRIQPVKLPRSKMHSCAIEDILDVLPDEDALALDAEIMRRREVNSIPLLKLVDLIADLGYRVSYGPLYTHSSRICNCFKRTPAPTADQA